MIIDIHTHLLPREIPKFKKQFGYGGFIEMHPAADPCCAKMMKDDGTFFREVDSRLWDATARLQHNNHYKTSVQVLSTVPVMFNYWAQPKDALITSQFLNDHLAEFIKQHPKRFIGLGTLPLQDPQLACEELERCMNTLHFAGVQIGTHINSWDLDAPELDIFFKTAEKLNASIFLHPWDMIGSDRLKKHWLPWLVGMPTESAIAISSLIMGGVIQKYPKLRIAVAHGGGSFPHLIGRIEHGFEVRPDLCATQTKTSPREQAKRFWVDSLVHDPFAFSTLLNTFGEDKIALGSDFPFPLGEDDPFPSFLRNKNIQETFKKQLCYQNALKWLGKQERDFQ